jgi:asparagine synthase (glutamine-hydrolysing)
MKCDMQTFSAVFDEEVFSEKKFIEKTIEKTKFKSSLIYTNAKNIEQGIKDLIYTIEEPFRSSAIACQHRLYQNIASSSSIKVVLNGQGADEVYKICSFV